MNTKDLIALGVPPGEATRRGIAFIADFILKGGDKLNLPAEVEAVVRAPGDFTTDKLRGEFAKALLKSNRPLQ